MSDALDPVDLAAFLQAIDRGDLHRRIAASPDADLLDTYLNESHVALELVRQHYEPGMRVLEVGGGICVFARFARAHGVDITVVEPVDDAFDFIGRAFDALAASVGGDLAVHRIPVEELSCDVHGRFDLVYSVNVLEHLNDVPRALDAIDGVLVADGVQVHTCPNYAVPYEPHFGVPLVPFKPALTGRLWARRQASMPLWQSLNWVTARQIRRWARSRRRRVRFEPGVMAAAASRLAVDAIFASRHRNVVGRVASSATVRSVFGVVPARLASPMTFAITRSG